MSRGEVRVGKIPDRFGLPILQPDGTFSHKHPVIPGFTNINVSSGGKYKALSPMKLGPFTLKERRVPTRWYPNGVHPGFTAVDDEYQQGIVLIFENYWQFSKIFPQDVIGGEVQKSFFERRAKMFTEHKGHRRAIPKSRGTAIAAYLDGNLLAYVPSRIYYITYYSYLVQLTPEFQELVNRLNSGENLHILGYDGYDPVSGLPYGANPLTYEAIEKAMYDPEKPFGHELVLAGLLSGIKPWENFDLEKAYG